MRYVLGIEVNIVWWKVGTLGNCCTPDMRYRCRACTSEVICWEFILQCRSENSSTRNRLSIDFEMEIHFQFHETSVTGNIPFQLQTSIQLYSILWQFQVGTKSDGTRNTIGTGLKQLWKNEKYKLWKKVEKYGPKKLLEKRRISR